MSEEEIRTIRGRLKFYSLPKGFGYIATAEGDVFVGKELGEKHLLQSKAGTMVEVVYKIQSLGRMATEISFPWYLGTVRYYDVNRGFGFIVCDGVGRDIFIHVSKTSELKRLPEKDMPVEFILMQNPDGRFVALSVRHPLSSEPPAVSEEPHKVPSVRMFADTDIEGERDDGRPAKKRRSMSVVS